MTRFSYMRLTQLPPLQSFSELFVSFLETEANRGAIMSSRSGVPVSTPTPLRSTSSLSHHRSPSTSSSSPFQHQRTPSSASNTSAQSAPGNFFQVSIVLMVCVIFLVQFSGKQFLEYEMVERRFSYENLSFCFDICVSKVNDVI